MSSMVWFPLDSFKEIQFRGQPGPVLTCNQQVTGSSSTAGSRRKILSVRHFCAIIPPEHNAKNIVLCHFCATFWVPRAKFKESKNRNAFRAVPETHQGQLVARRQLAQSVKIAPRKSTQKSKPTTQLKTATDHEYYTSNEFQLFLANR